MKILLGIGVLIGLGTVIATVIIGSRLSERTVVPDPYEAGLRWDGEQRERRSAAWMIALLKKRYPPGKQDVLLSITGRDGRPLRDVQVEVRFQRPYAKLSERALRAEPLRQGPYRFTADFSGPGRWDMEITVVRGDHRITFNESVTVEDAEASGPPVRQRQDR